jgi:hypothetical protein
MTDTKEKKKGGDVVPVETTAPQAPGTVTAGVDALEWWHPHNLSEAKMIANEIAKSGLVPDGYKDHPEKVLTAWLFGAPLGLGVLSCLQFVSVVKGRPALYGDAIPAVVKRARGKIEESYEGTYPEDNYTAVCIVTRPGEKDVRGEFSILDAKTAGLWGMKSNKGEPMPWTQYPKRMLKMRARAFACRDQFPDALAGILIREEAEDIRDITEDVTVTDAEPEKGTAGLGAKLDEKKKRDAEASAHHDEQMEKEAAAHERDADSIAFAFFGKERPPQARDVEGKDRTFFPWAVWLNPRNITADEFLRFEPKAGLTEELRSGEIEFAYWEWRPFTPTTEGFQFIRERVTKPTREAAKDAGVSSKKLLAWCSLQAKLGKPAKKADDLPVGVVASAYWAMVDGELMPDRGSK